ncbi:malto-oligosyltrehalose synthase [Nakamurella flavida]|uniref:Malto-oligosyltrehalose synthase n=1 Tax=Nakamurella flavida TaxID=363630 RepID=A0A939C1Q9_9ACTN|nr:malto-oligosyltrehalose synthase [Nakamurella flavida]MBM9475261.1 malto-oligosyltrehalose synthase [Nakamurella flavida]MDP9776835.1 (1->4)-alpha-D-glucan 1-alpha-D-glucosylmutase [Nakamurella flavida]
MKIPVSTYRLQITESFDLHAAAALVPQIARLGADWVYLSPILQAEEGSEHGYDVTDHSRVDVSRGGSAGLAAVAQAAHAAGLGVLADIVPNHVGVATAAQSVWWWDVLTHGRGSRYAEAFDIDWAAGDGRLRLPVLGDGPDELDELVVKDGELHYYDNRYPIAAGTGGGTAKQVHDRQAYELVSWRRADAELNYRRFFAVTTLAGIRVELPAVFDESHAEIKRWIDEGLIDGLRIDHPDGLYDPGAYLDRLAQLTGGRYVLVEKIIEGDETVPASWATAGTTGYEALAALDRVLVDPAGQEALDLLDTDLRGGLVVDWGRMTRSTKRAVADGILRSEVLRLARLVPDIEGADDAIAELLSSFSVYRTYLPLGEQYLDEALAFATATRPDLADTLRQVSERLREIGTEFSTRFQQTSGMVMAKGVEDCAFYRWTRLTSLTEVGADPAEFSLPPQEFHRVQIERGRRSPYAMTTMTTHDTKRSEDTRARISVVAEIAADWSADVRQWLAWAPLADGPLANLLFQAAVGAWPIERERLHAYAEKASREAGNSTAWIDGDEDFEKTMHALVDAIYDHPRLHAAVLRTVDRLAGPGRVNGLTAKLVQLTSTGVPDVYQGSELWERSLVDPDNRRPVDHPLRAELLTRIDGGWVPPVDEEGAAKLLVTTRALHLRRDRPELFTGYTPITASGPAADHLLGFDRGGAITLATRLPVGLERVGGWSGTTVELSADLTDVLTGRELAGGTTEVGELFAHYPVALLAPTER